MPVPTSAGGGLPGGADGLRPGARSGPGRLARFDRLSGAAFATLQATMVYRRGASGDALAHLGVLSVCSAPAGRVPVAGWLADLIGAPQATAITGAMGLLALAATWPLWAADLNERLVACFMAAAYQACMSRVLVFSLACSLLALPVSARATMPPIAPSSETSPPNIPAAPAATAVPGRISRPPKPSPIVARATPRPEFPSSRRSCAANGFTLPTR